MTIQNLKPADALDIVIRRKWLILSVIVCCIGIAWGVCFILPKSFRSSTLILVENQRIPERYVSPAVGGTVSERLTMINQYVLSRTVLGEIIEEFKLLGDEKNDPMRKEEFLATMRKNVKVETKGGGRVEAFSISFAHSDPVMAMNVTARLASKFVDENLKSREELVVGTTEFLDAELARAKEALERQEDAIAHFKRKFMGELPGQIEANLQTLNRLEKELASLEVTLQNRADRRLAIQRMLQGYETLGLSMVSERQSEGLESMGNNIQSASSSQRGSSVRTFPGAGSNPLLTRLRELERTLTALSAEYKSTYPDIVRVKQEIAQVKAALAEKTSGTVNSEGREVDTDVPAASEPTEKVRREKKPIPTGIDPYLFELKKELNENDIGIAALKEDQARHRTLAKEYQQRVERAPEREQELIVLQRDYDNTKKNYESLLEKKLNARISENLEKRQKGESFKILDPANLPTTPESPDVARIMLLGLVMGCGLGFGSALALEQFMGVIRRPEDVESLLGLPVLASIPKFDIAYKKLSVKQLSQLGSRADDSSPQSDHGTALLECNKKETVHPGKAKLVTAGKTHRYYGGRYGNQGSVSEQFEGELNLVAKWRPMSVVSEQYRVAATRLVLLSGSQKGSVVVVTSSIPGEGKSSTASNLAYVLAHDLGKATILIDCDFKKPTLHAYNGIPSQPGLAELLYGDLPIDSCIHQTDPSGLWVLPAGRRDHKLVDLAKIPDLKKIVSDLKGRFEYVVLDTPPILPLADINLLAAMADILLLVVRAEMTPQDAVEKAVKKLGVQGRSGIILNGCHLSPATTGYLKDYYHVTPGAYLG